MTKNQNRRFSGYPRDFSILKFIRDEIAQKNNGLGGKFFDALRECEEVHRIQCRRLPTKTTHLALRIQSAAARSSSAIKSGGSGHLAAYPSISPTPYPLRT